MAGQANPQIQCKTCDVGTLQMKKKFRMSGIVVTIGYILLIPSALGMLGSVFSLIGMAATTTASPGGAAIAGGVAVFFGILSLVGGLFGYLLIMKKNILQCNTCGAAIAAS